ncbi:hypothetical protein DCC39_04540 [Pueribacillus theae]|uniref:Uncharacterized protein n=1 Tax=Pueribacillus theae TaxID=2171751 RepID=A0A2U1K747_9BACI|nr:hypothetical protein [Pueribacillus theae]PWA12708.1 hypothetical protein DCC39_04540 [Pueribacillus theae]
MSKLSDLSHPRLVLRTMYYQDMTLKLEKEVAFKDYEISKLKKQLKKLQAENNGRSDERNHKEKMEQYNQQLQKLEEENKQLKEKLESMKDIQTSNPELEKKIEGFEELLSEIQIELTQKEKEVDYYKSRVKNLEKRAPHLPVPQSDHNKLTLDTSSEKGYKDDLAIITYFDYSIVWQSENRLIIRGDFHIKNIGNQTLKNPVLCFRFSPPEFSNMKGKIISVDQAAANKQISQHNATNWMFLESEWAEDAKERGEIWIVPINDFMLNEGETVSLNEFQIPVQTEFKDTLIVEGFVYFSDIPLKVKSSNNIIISF